MAELLTLKQVRFFWLTLYFLFEHKRSILDLYYTVASTKID